MKNLYCEIAEYIDETIICRYTGKECIYSFSPIKRDCDYLLKYNKKVQLYLKMKENNKYARL